MDREGAFDSRKYISARGEGLTEDEARENALSQISFYFDTNISVSYSMVSSYSQTQINDFYHSAEHTDIQEKIQMDSAAQLFCVQYTSAYIKDGTFYVVAFVDREAAYKTYKENISINASILRSLLGTARRTDNPFYSVPACTKGEAVANLTAQLIKNIHAVKEDARDDFSAQSALVEEMLLVSRNCKDRLSFSITVDGDWNNTVYNELSELVEDLGFVVSDSQDSCRFYAVVEDNRSVNDAGVFLTCALSVQAFDSNGQEAFTYHQTFARQGAPAQYEETAWRKSFAAIREDLQKNLRAEFTALMK